MTITEQPAKAPKENRVHISNQGGRTVYSVKAWPGKAEIISTLTFFLMIIFLLSVFLFFGYQIERSFGQLTPFDWLNNILVVIVGGGLDPFFTIVLVFLAIWAPFYFIYQISPKQFWVENNILVHQIQYLGLINRTRSIPFDRIYEIKISQSTTTYQSSFSRNEVKFTIYGLYVIYEMDLPGWLKMILVYWNEKFTRWPMGIMNSIPTKEEAEQLQAVLLEPMTGTKKQIPQKVASTGT